MKFLINVLPNDQFTLTGLKQFIFNIKNQRANNVELIFKKCPSLDQHLVNYVEDRYPDSRVVNQYQDLKLGSDDTYYWLNLHDTDCLLPNALIQWQQIIKRHASRLLQFKYLSNSVSLTDQVDNIIERFNHRHPIRIETVKQMMNLPVNVQLFQLSFSQKLAILLGIQRYKIRDGRRRFRLLKSPNLGFDVAYQCFPNDLKKMDRSPLLDVFDLVLTLPEFVKVELPTLVLGDLSLKNRFQWLLRIIRMQTLVKNQRILKKYHKSVSHKVIGFKKRVLKSDLRWISKFALVSKVNHAVKSVDHSLKEA